MITENLLRCSSLFIFQLLFLQTCNGINPTTNPYICSPSACGDIRNISFPFRLKHEPKHCGYPEYELTCENDVLYLNSQQKYKVKEINYHNFTIKAVSVSINNTNTCSVPNFSAYPYKFNPYSNHIGKYPNTTEVAWPINYMSCPYPLKNSPFLALTNDCASNMVNSRHAYIKVGHMNASEVGHLCRIDMIAMTSWKFEDLKNISVSEIHDSLLYGFELSLWRYDCGPGPCKPTPFCSIGEDYKFICGSVPSSVTIIVIAGLLVVVFVGVSIPAKIILGFACYFGISYFLTGEWSALSFNPETFALDLEITGFYLGISLAARLIIGFICLMGFLIYKFRRRHISMFDAIESFLRSDNKLMPIRYSYSNIKKMTRGFREELGQGGYGKVYKGKLQSGYDVAVKVLRKPGGNGQDFMNEIATIGRIHHVNIVNLVGYCAERSKRALVFDFMPNCSLDKYIFGREKMKCLSWEKKYEIAIGVARGIEYLHTGCDIQILHFDIKPHNILLDHNFTPKISDFGLAKFYSTDKNFVTMTTARGTIGYVAPELINRGFGGVSYKADVYSFGMLLMEMVGLNRNFKGNTQASSQYFPCWIYDCFEQGQDIEIEGMDENSNDDNNDTNNKIAKKMTIVALWCIQMNPGDRPSMNKVVQMLEDQVERLQVPNRPSQSPQVGLQVSNRPPQSPQVAISVESQSWSTYSVDSTSLISHDAVPSIEITVVD